MVVALATVYSFLIYYFYMFNLAAPYSCGILVPLTRDQTLSPVLEAQSPNHWTTREVPHTLDCGFRPRGHRTPPLAPDMVPACTKGKKERK